MRVTCQAFIIGYGMETPLTLGHHSEEAEDEGRHGHQASLGDGLDFVNTLSYNKGEPHEHLTDAPTAVHWLQHHALLHQEMADAILADAKDADGEERLLTRIRRVRQRFTPNGEVLGIGVDRMDYSKGLEEKLKALDFLWQRYPEWREKFTFVQIAVPTRTMVAPS